MRPVCDHDRISTTDSYAITTMKLRQVNFFFVSSSHSSLHFSPIHHISCKPKWQEQMDIANDQKPRPRSAQLLLTFRQGIFISTCLFTLLGFSNILQVSWIYKRTTTKVYVIFTFFCGMFYEITDSNTGCPEEIANEPSGGKRDVACNIVIIMPITP